MRFTQARVNSLKPPAGKADHEEIDEAMPGFGIRFRNGGSGTYFIKYTWVDNFSNQSGSSPEATIVLTEPLSDIRVGGPTPSNSAATCRSKFPLIPSPPFSPPSNTRILSSFSLAASLHCSAIAAFSAISFLRAATQ